MVDKPFPSAAVVATDAKVAYREVLAAAGASAYINARGEWVERRDDVDLRIVNDVKTGQGRIINDPSEVGGWPDLARGTPPKDSDKDGMPDEWETLHKFNPNSPDDGPRDRDQDGYTNLEEYLNGTKP